MLARRIEKAKPLTRANRKLEEIHRLCDFVRIVQNEPLLAEREIGT
jgi:hypothetical protein